MSERDRRIVKGQQPADGITPTLVSDPRDGFNAGYQTPNRPNKPTGLDLNAFADGGEIWIVADWDPGLLNPAGAVTQWVVEWKEQGDTFPPNVQPYNADQYPPVKIPNLLPNTTYDIAVRALTAQGASSDSLTGSCDTGHDDTPPPQVTGLTGGAGYKSVTIKWDSLGTILDPFRGKYIIEAATASDFSTGLVEYDNADSNVANIGNLTTGTQYFFRVHARSSSGIDGDPSATVSFTPGLADAASLPSDGVVPTAVTAAPTVSGGPGYFFVKWPSIATSNDDIITYEIHMSTSSSFSPSSATKTIEVVGSDQGFVRKLPSGAALAYGTNYYFAIRTKDRDGYSTGGTANDGLGPIAGPSQMAQINTPDIVVGSITAASGIILDLNADIITAGTLNGTNVNVTNLSAAALVSGNISADVGYLGDLTADQITSGVLNATIVDVVHLNASNITTGTISASRISAGSIGAYLIELQAGGTIRTVNYGTSGGTDGWMLDGAGNLVANSVVLRGTLVTTNGALNIEIGSNGVNEISFNAADQSARGFIQHAGSGYLRVQAPTVSGHYPGYIEMLNDIVSLGLDGASANLVLRPTYTQVAKDLDTGTYAILGSYDGTLAPAIRMRGDGVHTFSTRWDGAAMHLFTDVSDVKTFVLPHPTQPDRWLVHGTMEGPEAGVYYRGEGRLEDGWAEIELPSYFEALCEEGGRSVQLTCIADNVEDEWCPVLHATCPKDGRFHVGLGSGMKIHDQRFWWEVKAVRRNTDLDAEPLRSEVSVLGDGPYTYTAMAGAR